MTQNFFAKDDFLGGLDDLFFKAELEKASIKLAKLNAYSLYFKYGEIAVKDTYPEYAEFVLANVHLSFKDFQDLVSY